MVYVINMACVILSNLGAAISEVAYDALLTEFSRTHKEGQLQSYSFTTTTSGILLGNLLVGFILRNTQEPRIMFFSFSVLLIIQLAFSLAIKENLPDSSKPLNHHQAESSVSENLRKQFYDGMKAISDEKIFYPLLWIVGSVAVVPLMAGATFCFQTQVLMIDPSIIGLSRMLGQLMNLGGTFIYKRYLKHYSTRQVIAGVQILYALSVFSDLILVKQINLKMGISNKVYVLIFSALAESVTQFKIFPFTILFSTLCPPGCEGSLLAFFASAMSLATMWGGFYGIGVCYIFGVTSGQYSRLPLTISLQFLAALIPMTWMSWLPGSPNVNEIEMTKLG